MATNQRESSLALRKALAGDGIAIQKLINYYGEKGEMLPRSLNDIYENIRDFSVIVKAGKVIGCGALHVCWDDLAEIRGLAIKESELGRGYGRMLVEQALSEAAGLGLKKVFCLTYRPEFFERRGFKRVEHKELPAKIWKDCINCPKFPDCSEIALIREIG